MKYKVGDKVLFIQPGLSLSQIQVLIRELREDGKVICIGKTSAAR